MASPIFISKPSESFSIWLVLRGIQFALLSTYRSLQNPSIQYHTTYYPFMIKTIKLSLLFYLVSNAPFFITKTIVFCGNYFGLIDVNSRFLLNNSKYFLHTFLNLNVFLISFVNYFDANSDELFMLNIKFSDQINSTNYHKNLNALPNKKLVGDVHYPKGVKGGVGVPSSSDVHQPVHNTFGVIFNNNFYKMFKLHTNNSPYFKHFIKRYTNYYLFNMLIYGLILFPSKVSTILLSFISFQTFLGKLGSIPSLILITILNFLSPYHTGTILATFYGSTNLSKDLLLAYFHRVNFTTFERKVWYQSREGLLFGFGLVNFLLINKFPQLAVLFYTFAQLNMGYLITKLTDEPPANSNQLINWSETQLIWKKVHSVINGDFVDDPYIGFPGSFILAQD